MVKNFIIDRIVRGNMYSTKDGSLLWGLNQITDPSLTMESESVDATDAMGTPIMSFDRSKTCTFSASNAIFDIPLLGAQTGSEAVSGSTTIPAFETLDVQGTTVKLAHTPKSLDYIYVLNGDGSIGTAYGKDTFSLTGATVTLPSAVTSGQVFVSYEYTGNATSVVNSASKFPTAGKFVMEVLGRDVCDSTTEVFAYLVLPNAKLSASTDLTLDTELSQSFELNCAQS